MSKPRYIVGIDLGTTHTAMACASLADTSAHPALRVINIPQTVRPGAVEKRPLLPSCVYLPAENELPAGSLALPWCEASPRTPDGAEYVVGEFARERGAELPGRLVESAKSWLCQPRLDRRAALLPVHAPPDVRRLSAVEASSLILAHLAAAWAHEFAGESGVGPLSAQQIVLCIPASFDAAARGLTLEAARLAGLHGVTLLEEPQAAFYSWVEQSQDRWRQQVCVGELILVVDAGGGTTDFSLIAVEGEAGALALRRIAVGEHILLGGDNMDLALAREAAARFTSEGARLDAWQLRALAHACRAAKEKLLGAQPPAAPQHTAASAHTPAAPLTRPTRRRGKNRADSVSAAAPDGSTAPLVVLGRGAGVIGAALRGELARAEVERIVLDGFFPACSAFDRPRLAAQSGLRELGLNYAADPALTKHLARFLAFEHTSIKNLAPRAHPAGGQPKPHAGETDSASPAAPLACPSAILFNGGVMQSPALRSRTLEAVAQWVTAAGAQPPRVLEAAQLELAVARGAAYCGLAQRGKGVRIRGGAARAYYIGLESSAPAIPGVQPPLKALCVAPLGADDGEEFLIDGAEFGLVVGAPARFRFFASAARRGDQAGDVAPLLDGQFNELPPLETHLNGVDAPSGALIPVRLRSRIAPGGNLELWCHAAPDAESEQPGHDGLERGAGFTKDPHETAQNAAASAGPWKLELDLHGATGEKNTNLA